MSVISIQDTFYLRVQVEDTDLDSMNATFNSVAITESIGQIAPAVKISLYDSTGTYSHENSMVEGTKILIEMAKGPEGLDGVYYRGVYRLFGSKNSEGPFSGHLWDLVFLLNIPKYTIKSCTEVYSYGKNSIMSCEAMQQIASNSGLSYDKSSLTYTNDKQRWLNIAQTRASFAEYISSRGYISDRSCTLHGVTANSILVYKDILQQSIEGKPKATFLHNTDKSSDIQETPLYWVREAKSVNSAGLFNSWLNYGYKTIQQSLSGTPIVTNKLDAVSTGKYFPINRDIKDDIDGESRIYYSNYFDSGSGDINDDANNIHANYHKSYYQNLRYRLLFSQSVQVLIEDQTLLQILDVVQFIQHDLLNGAYTINPRSSGKYIIVSKTIYGKAGSNYYEKFVLSRSHVTETGRTNLIQ